MSKKSIDPSVKSLCLVRVSYAIIEHKIELRGLTDPKEIENIEALIEDFKELREEIRNDQIIKYEFRNGQIIKHGIIKPKELESMNGNLTKGKEKINDDESHVDKDE